MTPLTDAERKELTACLATGNPFRRNGCIGDPMSLLEAAARAGLASRTLLNPPDATVLTHALYGDLSGMALRATVLRVDDFKVGEALKLAERPISFRCRSVLRFDTDPGEDAGPCASTTMGIAALHPSTKDEIHERRASSSGRGPSTLPTPAPASKPRSSRRHTARGCVRWPSGRRRS